VIIKVPYRDVDNPVDHSKMKHVEFHTHYLQYFVHDDIVSVEYCHIEDQVVDIFTKPLAEAIFINLHTFLGLQEVEIMGRCSCNVISLYESPKLCIDGGFWNIKH
jgi:hypothetical protein